MSARGFTLVELLVALVVLLLVSASAFALIGPARAAFDTPSATIDLRQRSRAGADVFLQSLLGAGGHVGTDEFVHRLPSLVPAIWPTSSAPSGAPDTFNDVMTITAVDSGGRGRLEFDQAGPSSVLTLSPDGCPLSGVVCGFGTGSLVVIFDRRGRFDLFQVGGVAAATRTLVPAAPLARSYEASAEVVEVEVGRLHLRLEPDGSRTLVRTTWAGARQPIMGGVASLELRAMGVAAPPFLEDAAGPDASGLSSYGPPPPPAAAPDPDRVWPDGEHCLAARDAIGPRSRLDPWGGSEAMVEVRPADLLDGPWCPTPSARDAYDADVFRVRRVDIILRLEALAARSRGSSGRFFARPGHAAATQWVPDQEVVLTVTRR